MHRTKCAAPNKSYGTIEGNLAVGYERHATKRPVQQKDEETPGKMITPATAHELLSLLQHVMYEVDLDDNWTDIQKDAGRTVVYRMTARINGITSRIPIPPTQPESRLKLPDEDPRTPPPPPSSEPQNSTT